MARISRDQTFSQVPLLMLLSRLATPKKPILLYKLSKQAVADCLSGGPLQASHLPGCLTSLELGTGTDDSILRCLASSSLSKTLLELSIGDTHLTDDSAQCWQQFTSLKSLTVGSLYQTMTTFNAILNDVPSLTSLNLWLRNVELFTAALKAVLEGGHALCNLQEFTADMKSKTLDDEPVAQLVLSSLAKNPALCASLRHLSWYRRGGAVPVSLLQFCSNLRGLRFADFPWSQVKELAPQMQSFDSLRVHTFPSNRMTQEDVEWIGAQFPFLTSLTILTPYERKLTVSATSLQGLAELRELTAAGTRWDCFRFPRSLRALTIDVLFSDSEDPQRTFFQDFLRALSPLQQLESLHLTGPGGTHESYMAIIASLTNLGEIQLSALSSSAPIGRFPSDQMLELSHPNLRSVCSLELAFGRHVVPKFVPRLRELPYYSTSLPTLSAWMRKVTSVQFDGSLQDSFASLSVLSGLRSISAVSASALQLASLSSLSQLRELWLYGHAALTTSLLEQILGGLPLLTELRLLADAAPLASFEWLKHDRLRSFLCRSTVTAPVGSAPLRFASLPSLFSLDLGLSGLVPYGLDIAVDGLVSLADLQFNLSLEASSCSCAVRNCPSLYSIALTWPSLTSLAMENLPSAFKLKLSNCARLRSESCRFDLPALREYSVLFRGAENEANATTASAISSKIAASAPLATRDAFGPSNLIKWPWSAV